MVFRRSGGGVGDQSSPTEYKRGVTHVENRLPREGGREVVKRILQSLMVLSGKFYHDTSKIHWPPPPPSLPPGEKRWQVPNKRLSTSSGTNASNHKVNSKNQPVQYGRTFQPVISKKKKMTIGLDSIKRVSLFWKWKLIWAKSLLVLSFSLVKAACLRSMLSKLV